MKAFLLSLLAIPLGVLPVSAAVPPAELVGNYQALLYTGTDNTGTPAGLLTLSVTKTGTATGKLTTVENKTYPITTKFDYTSDAPVKAKGSLLGTAVPVTAINITRPKMSTLGLALTLENESSGPVLKVQLTEPEAPTRFTNSGFKNVVFAPKTVATWAGKYTLAFELAEAAPAGAPEGSGYATGTVTTTGLLNLVGKTGDGVAFTAALPAGPDRNYVAYLNPYKTAGSFFGGKITLVNRTSNGVHHVPAPDPNVDFKIQKAPKNTDTAYRTGYGPLGLLLTMEPWQTVPALPKGQTLGTLLGLTPEKVFDLAFQGGFTPASYPTRIPTSLGLNANNTFRVATGLAGSPSSIYQDQWSKFFTLKVDPATGKITGSLTLEHTLPIVPPATTAAKVTRKLTLEGVMLQLESGDTSPFFAQGFILVPPVNPKTETTLSGMFAFEGGSVQVDPFVAASAATAGRYTINMNRFFEYDLDGFEGPGVTINITGKMVGTPDSGATVPFTIAPDLKSLTFFGRKIPLAGDSRPVSLVYTDITDKNVKNTLKVIVYLDGNGQPTALAVEYMQLLAAKISTALPPPIGTRTVAGLVPGFATYVQNGPPVKVVP